MPNDSTTEAPAAEVGRSPPCARSGGQPRAPPERSAAIPGRAARPRSPRARRTCRPWTGRDRQWRGENRPPPLLAGGDHRSTRYPQRKTGDGGGCKGNSRQSPRDQEAGGSARNPRPPHARDHRAPIRARERLAGAGHGARSRCIPPRHGIAPRAVWLRERAPAPAAAQSPRAHNVFSPRQASNATAPELDVLVPDFELPLETETRWIHELEKPRACYRSCKRRFVVSASRLSPVLSLSRHRIDPPSRLPRPDLVTSSRAPRD